MKWNTKRKNPLHYWVHTTVGFFTLLTNLEIANCSRNKQDLEVTSSKKLF